MNLCMKSTHVQNGSIIIDSLKCSNNNFDEKLQDLQENFNKIAIPNLAVRSSSLSKISNSCQKNTKPLLKNTTKTIHLSPNNQQIRNQARKNEAQLKQSKRNCQNNTKSVIVNKLFSTNQIQKNPNSNLKNKQNHNQKQKNCLPSDNFYHKHQNVDKLIILYKQKTQKELKQCTFNPKVRGQLSSRSIDTQQFYKHQLQHTKRTEDKIQQMREMIKAEKQKDNTFRPKLSEETHQLTERRKNINVYDRLYDLNREGKFKQVENSLNKSKDNIIQRNVSKKSITLISSRKKVSDAGLSQQKDSQSNLVKIQSFSRENSSKILMKDKSVKKFQEMFQRKQSQILNSNQKKQESNAFYTKWQRPTDSKQQSFENFQKKNNSQNYGIQLLDCKELIRQKRNSANLLSREQSCKLITSSTKNLNQFSRKKNQDLPNNHNNQTNVQRNKTTEKNEKISLEKFTKQFFIVSHKMGLKNQINFNQMISLMNNMNFIENLQQFYESKIDSQIKQKAFEIWTLLQGIEGQNIILMNLFKVFCAIQGFRKSSIIEQTIKQVSQGFNLQYLIKNKQDKRLILSQKDSKTIKKDFMNFYLTRFKLGESKLYTRQSSNIQFSFHPSISKETEQYAEKYRERVIAQSQKLINEGSIEFSVPQNGLIDHSSLLILDQKIKNFKIEQKRKQTQKEKIRKQDESMIHHSSTNRSINQTSIMQKHKKSITKGESQLDSNMFSRISHNDSHSRTKDQIFAELYEHGKRSKSNRRDRSAEQIQYESSKGELTFKPKINQTKPVSEFHQEISPHDQIPNYTKQVMRMRKNRNNQKEDLSISPLLYLNVTMQGNHHAKIPVYQADTLPEVAEKVRVMMKIENGEEENKKLRQILKQQIIPVFDQLGMKERSGRLFSEK